LARSDLSIPEAIAKAMSLYLMMAIGFKGGASVAQHGLDAKLLLAILAGVALSAAIPLIAFRLLIATSNLPRVDAAAIAAHYGSISIVTFLAATQALELSGIKFEGYMVAVAAAMETPAIIAALWLARTGETRMDSTTLREVMLNGSIVMLVGSFLIGVVTGADGMKAISAFIVDPFKGILCLSSSRWASLPAAAFARAARTSPCRSSSSGFTCRSSAVHSALWRPCCSVCRSAVPR
jgi:uncharacterized protein